MKILKWLFCNPINEYNQEVYLKKFIFKKKNFAHTIPIPSQYKLIWIPLDRLKSKDI